MSNLIRMASTLCIKLIQIEKIIRLELKLVRRYIQMSRQEKIEWLTKQNESRTK